MMDVYYTYYIVTCLSRIHNIPPNAGYRIVKYNQYYMRFITFLHILWLKYLVIVMNKLLMSTRNAAQHPLHHWLRVSARQTSRPRGWWTNIPRGPSGIYRLHLCRGPSACFNLSLKQFITLKLRGAMVLFIIYISHSYASRHPFSDLVTHRVYHNPFKVP